MEWKYRYILGVISTVGLISACSTSDGDADKCFKDTDCKGNRICGTSGRCVDPDGDIEGDAQSGVGDNSDSPEKGDVREDRSLSVKIAAEPESGEAPMKVGFRAVPQIVSDAGGQIRMIDEDVSEDENLEFKYSWNFGDDSDASESRTPTYRYASPGAYTAEVTVNEVSPNNQLYRSTASVAINVEAPEFTVSVEADKSEARTGESVSFTCSLDTELSADLFDFEWSFDEQGLSASTQETTKAFSRTGPHQVTCQASLGKTTHSGSTSVNILENPQPTVTALNANPSTGTAPLEVSFNPTVRYRGDNAQLSYEWNFGDGHTSTVRAPTFTYSQSGNYTATATVTDPDGDRDSATVDIEVN